jgi:hypothetical protein
VLGAPCAYVAVDSCGGKGEGCMARVVSVVVGAVYGAELRFGLWLWRSGGHRVADGYGLDLVTTPDRAPRVKGSA